MLVDWRRRRRVDDFELLNAASRRRAADARLLSSKRLWPSGCAAASACTLCRRRRRHICARNIWIGKLASGVRDVRDGRLRFTRHHRRRRLAARVIYRVSKHLLIIVFVFEQRSLLREKGRCLVRQTFGNVLLANRVDRAAITIAQIRARARDQNKPKQLSARTRIIGRIWSAKKRHSLSLFDPRASVQQPFWRLQQFEKGCHSLAILLFATCSFLDVCDSTKDMFCLQQNPYAAADVSAFGYNLLGGGGGNTPSGAAASLGGAPPQFSPIAASIAPPLQILAQAVRKRHSRAF